MSKYYSNQDFKGQGEPSRNKKNRIWFKVLKICGWILGCLAVLCGIALWIIAYHVSPERIIKIIEKESSRYLMADIKIGNLDYKFFRSYPWLEFEADSLTVISKSLDNVSGDIKQELPLYADSLIFVEKIKGKINVAKLLHKDIKIKSLEINRPEINLVTVNDSIANYNIATHIAAPKKLPDIDVSEIKMEGPVALRYFSLQPELETDISIESFDLLKEEKRKYTIGFEGMIAGRYQQISLPGKVPVKFKASVEPHLPDLAINLDNLKLSLAGINLETDGDVNINPKSIDIESCLFRINIDDVFSLMDYVPATLADEIKLPEGLTGELPIEVTLSLTEPYQINPSQFDQLSLEMLPPVEAMLKIEDANLQFQPGKSKKIEANDVYMVTECYYNPKEPETSRLILRELRMNGEGINLTGEAEVSNLTGEKQDIRGKFAFSSPLMETLRYFLPSGGMNVRGFLKGDVKVDAVALNLGKGGMENISVSGDLSSHDLRVKPAKGTDLRLKNMHSGFAARIPAYPLKDYDGSRIGFTLKADTVETDYGKFEARLTGISLDMEGLDSVSGSPQPDADINLKIKNVNFSGPGNKLLAKDIELSASGNLTATSYSNVASIPATTPGNDAIIASRAEHTPLVLEYEGGGLLQTIMGMASIRSDVKVAQCSYESSEYLYPIEIEVLDLFTNLNKIQFKAKKIEAGNTGFAMTCDVDGLGAFLTSYAPTPLKITTDINFSNVDINELSWGYYGAQIAKGNDSVFYIPPVKPYGKGDSVCVVIPRNIDARINLKSKSAEYMQYSFSPLSTDIIVKDGAATLSNLTIGTPYCKAIVDWTYSTTDLSDIFMNLNAQVLNFKFEPFYKVFPQLVEKAPELNNLTGVVNAFVDCNFQMFPDMFMNAESLKGRFDIKGSDLSFSRHGKIEKITHLMLIHGDQPIKLENISITGGYHDNLLQINPFKICFDDYELEGAGINNTAGDMYYHLALLKSPFHLPFGASIYGNFKHPEFKLGGTRMDDYRSEKVWPEEPTKIDINIMSQLHYGWLLFIQEAAKYKGGIKEKKE